MSDTDFSNTLYKMALEYIEQGDARSLKELINQHNLNPNINECEFLRSSIVHNQSEIFTYLLNFYQKEWDNSDALCEASSLNYEKFVVALLPLTDPKVNQSEPLMWAARYNNIPLMDILLPLSNVFDAIELVHKYDPSAQSLANPSGKGVQYLEIWITNQMHSGAENGVKKL